MNKVKNGLGKFYFFIFNSLVFILFFASFVFSIGVSPESIVLEMDKDSIYTQEVIIYSSSEPEVEVSDGNFISFNLSSCEKYCKGNIIIDARYIESGQYREEISFYDIYDGNIISGVRLPLIIDINSTKFNLIEKLKDDKIVVGFFSGIIFLVILLGVAVFRR